jgi:hypothetical protein
MRRDLLSLFEHSSIHKVSRYPRRPPGVTSDAIWKAGRASASLHHREHFDAMHPTLGQQPPPIDGAEEWRLHLCRDSSSLKIHIDVFFRRMVRGQAQE